MGHIKSTIAFLIPVGLTVAGSAQRVGVLMYYHHRKSSKLVFYQQKISTIPINQLHSFSILYITILIKDEREV